MPMNTQPRVSLITVNYNGKHFLKPLLDSLLQQTYPSIEIVVVDNDSHDGSVEWLKENYPQIVIVPNKENLGFAGGNNSALPHCTGEWIGLINNDMIADPQYVEKLVEAGEKEQADVVGGKILFYTPFLPLTFSMKTFTPADNGGGDTRRLGCMVSDESGIEGVEYKKTLFLENTYGEEQSGDATFHWISDQAQVKIPVNPDQAQAVLKITLAVSEQQQSEKITIRIGDTVIFEEDVPSHFQEYSIPLDPALIRAHMHEVINNAGSEYDSHSGAGRDIGMYEEDRGQYDTIHPLKSVCGGSMLIRRKVIEQYGLFDEYFFMYYEDTDFCWRMNRAGKKMIFQPEAFVHHIHTGSSKEWSPFFRYHVERNRLALLFKNAALMDVLRHWTGFFLKTASSTARFIKRRIMKQSRDSMDEITFIHLRVCGNLIVHIPLFIWKRFKGTS
jgi:O-antigen biosynthesis protein